MSATAAKDYRITIRMSPEMGTWIEEQAKLHELEAAAFVRMTLAKAKLQAEHPVVVAAPLQIQPINPPPFHPGPDPYRGYSTGYVGGVEAVKVAAHRGGEQITQQPDPGDDLQQTYIDEPVQLPPVDVNAIVYQTLAEADAKGLTRPRQHGEDDEDDDHIPGLPRTVMDRGSWKEGGFRKTKEWAGR